MNEHNELFEHLYGSGEHDSCLKKMADKANARSRALRDGNRTNEQKRLFQRAQEKLFDELYKVCDGKEYGEALKEIADAANEKTRDMREARDEAFKVYSRLSEAYNLCWKEAWRTARDTMIVEANYE